MPKVGKKNNEKGRRIFQIPERFNYYFSYNNKIIHLFRYMNDFSINKKKTESENRLSRRNIDRQISTCK